ncbi:zinc finger MYM-type protein 1-like isoform X1 [Xyrichtys novacula]|uniref:Zinc finger MYM-type protein 1-like isoform X1 n=1 Tax=Xyrichtys novacula TaxID=13765 RepID=A0AAV1FZ15_XYRNO|nr:zinc finger MYM-type protein 1-like isoform X1 [Xyrichtys novacula]
MGEEIRREVNKAPFVSVMVDETTDASNAAQLALVLRYVTDTGVKERFVRFEDVTSGKRADDIAGLIIRFLVENECLGKVVAQCFDGAAVMSSGRNLPAASLSCGTNTVADKKLDVQFCLARVKQFCDTVERERSRYEEIYEATERTAGAPSAQRGPAQDPCAHYRQLHGRILDNIICQTQTRFQDHEKLIFVTLLDPQKFREYQKKFPHAAFSSLAQSQWNTFRSASAKNRTYRNVCHG